MMAIELRYHFRIHKEETGYWGQCIELPGCNAQADNRDELAYSMTEALTLFLDAPELSGRGHAVPNGLIAGAGIVEVPAAAKY